jgi:hypothetical protein
MGGAVRFADGERAAFRRFRVAQQHARPFGHERAKVRRQCFELLRETAAGHDLLLLTHETAETPRSVGDGGQLTQRVRQPRITRRPKEEVSPLRVAASPEPGYGAGSLVAVPPPE